MTDLAAVLDGLVADAPLERQSWADVLSRSRPARQGHAWLGGRGAAAVALAVAAAATVALVPTWSSAPDFTGRAAAALGSERYLRIEIVPPEAAFASVVDVASGRGRPANVRRVYWYDSRSATFHAWWFVDGVPVDDSDQILGNPGLAAFLGGYRAALADGSAEPAGRATDGGREVELIRFPASARTHMPGQCAYCYASYAPGTTIDVAVDRSTYRPVWYRINGSRLVEPATATRAAVTTTVLGRIYRIGAIAGFATTAARPTPRLPEIDGQATNGRPATRAGATAAFGRRPLWPAGSIGGLALHSATLERVTTYRDATGPVTFDGAGLHLSYGTGRRSIEIRESATPQASYGFSSPKLGRQGPLAPAGSMRIGCAGCAFGESAAGWSGQLRVDGIYLELSAPSRSLLLAAARALTTAAR